MTYNDITYCSRECANMECKRNQKHLPKGVKIISMAEFTDCENWKEVDADFMFEALEYKKIENDKEIKYEHDHEIMGERFWYDITFWKPSEMVVLHGINGLHKDELKAINKKCQELGWE